MITARAATTAPPWLLAGPGPNAGPEGLGDHVDRLGPLPGGGAELLEVLGASGLQGRGGARFPAAVKWRSVADRARGRAVVLVNGAEGEPASWKDQMLMSLRPHLVLDGAVLAAQSVGAAEVVLYVNRALPHAATALERALEEREGGGWQVAGRWRQPRARLVTAPPRYVAGEETAAVSLLAGRDAKPRPVPPRPYERGAGGRPTLVQNVETVALAALIGRFGAGWFRSIGTPASPGPLLVTVRGAVAAPGVYEIAHGTTLGEAVSMAGGRAGSAPAVLLGGYFGSWVAGVHAAALPLDDPGVAAAGAGLGCGVVFVLPEGACGVAETARIVAYLAAESARQCGPCREGLPAVAGLLQRVAAGRAAVGDAERLRRWTGQLASGRGACKHPDGAIGLVRSAMAVFADDLQDHLWHRPCPGAGRSAGLPFPAPSEAWR